MGFREAGNKKTSANMLAFGDTNSGKSYFGLTMPDSATIDSENGISHYEGKDVEIGGKTYNNVMLVNNTADLDELEESLDLFLYEDDSVKNIKTLIIDSETKFYYTMQIASMEVEEKRARKTGGEVNDQTVSQRQWGRIKLINMKMQQIKIDLTARGINILSTAQAADLRDESGKNIIGRKPDMHKTARYDYDTILEFYTEDNEETGEVKYLARVHKDRTNVTKRGDVIQNCTYDIWKDYFEGQKGEQIDSHFSKDLEKSVNDMEDLAEKQSELKDGILAKLKEFKVKSNAKGAQAVVKMLKSKEMNIKNLDIYDVKDLQEVLDLAELQ